MEPIVADQTSPDLIAFSAESPQPQFLPIQPAVPQVLPWSELSVLGSEMRVTVSPNLFESLTSAQTYGTIYIRTGGSQVESARREHSKRDESSSSRVAHERYDAQKPSLPSTADLFELLAPILLPPQRARPGEKLEIPHELWSFQREGVKFLYDHDGALLADDMGLGKTVQALIALRILVREGLVFRALVVCPKSVVRNWRKEAQNWAPELSTLLVEGGAPAREMAWSTSAYRSHLVIATYGIIRNDVDQIIQHSFDLVIADEVHTIRNPNAQQSRAIKTLKAKRRWGLSGTPMTGNLTDLESVFDFITPGKLVGLADQPTDVVQRRIAPFVKRRSRSEVLPDLPEKVSAYVPLELTLQQRETYDRAQRDGVIYLKGLGELTLQHVFALITKLKQVCNFDIVSGSSCKLEYLHENMPAMLSDNGKALVFSQYRETLDVLSREFQEYGPLTYHGGLSSAQREALLNSFDVESSSRLLLISLGAGGTGLNLQRANYVVHFDKWWNPAVTRQAEDRVHRIGQTRTVFVTHLVCVDTIEDRIEQILERKRALFGEIFEGLTDDDLASTITPKEFFDLFDLQTPKRYEAQPPGSAKESTSAAESTKVDPIEPIESDAFALIRNVEIALRGVIRSGLSESTGRWWRSKWPEPIWRAAEDRAANSKVAGGTPDAVYVDPCDFLEMGDYIQIITRSDNWKDSFKDLFGDTETIRVYLRQLMPIRNSVMHARKLSPEERADLDTFARLILNCTSKGLHPENRR